MSKKPKGPPPIASIEEFRETVDSIVQDDLQRQRLVLNLEQKIAALRENAAPSINDLTERIETALKRAAKFATLKRAEIFPEDRKEATTTLAAFGFRLGNKTLKLCEGFTWQDVVESIRIKASDLRKRAAKAAGGGDDVKAAELAALAEKWEALIVTTTDPVKDLIKSSLTNAERAAIGTEITQKESFWVEPKTEEPASPGVINAAA